MTPADQKGRHLGATVTGTARVLGPEAVEPAAPVRSTAGTASPVRSPRSSAIAAGSATCIVEVTLDAVP